MGKRGAFSDCPGPSTASVAIPRRRNSFSMVNSSSFDESSPGTSSTSGGRFASRGRRRIPGITAPSNGTSTLSPGGSRCGSAFA